MNYIIKIVALIFLGILLYQIHQVIQMNRYIYKYNTTNDILMTALHRVDRVTGVTQSKFLVAGDSWVSWNTFAERNRKRIEELKTK